MSDPGFERTLRHALHTELSLRLRHTLLHGLKGPVQTILSALHLMQKKAAAGQIEELDKYAGWIKNAANELIERAQVILPPKPSTDGDPAVDLHALTESATHLLRDEAAVRAIELNVATPTGPSLARGPAADLQLAVQAILFGVLDRLPAESRAQITVQKTALAVEWMLETDGGEKPPMAAFELQFDVQPPHSGIAWHVARAIVEERAGQFAVEDSGAGAWRIRFSVPCA